MPLDPLESLRLALNPRSIALVGASGNPNKIGGRPLAFLSRGNAWIQTLPTLSSLVPRVRSFASDVDVIVYPPETCEAGEHELMHAIGHAHLLTSPAVAERVADAVRALIVDAGRLP
jgi:hypothetical protein